jgi:hypothetical protein
LLVERSLSISQMALAWIVGKEMPIFRIVIAVPNTSYCCLTRLVDRSERESCLLLACDLLVAFR